jgi:uncharacterized protein (DUF427 family)
VSLTVASGPLTAEPAPRNFEVAGPAHRLWFEPLGRRIRLQIGGEVVLDTDEARLLHETGLRPRLYVPLADAREQLLRPSETRSHCPFKGDASYRSVAVGERVAADALWVYDEPLPAATWLLGYAGVYEERFDRVLDEDEPVLGWVPDPYHRVEVRTASREVRVTGPDGAVWASSRRALVVCETGAPRVLYVPREDVVAPVEREERVGVSPYFGVATHWSVAGMPGAAWSYEAPVAGAERLAGHVAFGGEGVAVREVG